MKELETEFIGRGEVKGFHFKQVFRSMTAYMYEVIPPNSCSYYEVFQRRVNERYDTVTYPKSSSFGRYAFTYLDFNTALKKFREL